MSCVKRWNWLPKLLVAMTLSLLVVPAWSEITDLKVADPEVLPVVVVTIGCPVSEADLERIVDEELTRLGVRRVKVMDRSGMWYSSALFCRKHDPEGYLFMLQFFFQKDVNGLTMAFSEQGFQVNADVGDEKDIRKKFRSSLQFSLSDYRRQNEL